MRSGLLKMEKLVYIQQKIEFDDLNSPQETARDAKDEGDDIRRNSDKTLQKLLSTLNAAQEYEGRRSLRYEYSRSLSCASKSPRVKKDSIFKQQHLQQQLIDLPVIKDNNDDFTDYDWSIMNTNLLNYSIKRIN